MSNLFIYMHIFGFQNQHNLEPASRCWPLDAGLSCSYGVVLYSVLLYSITVGSPMTALPLWWWQRLSMMQRPSVGQWPFPLFHGPTLSLWWCPASSLAEAVQDAEAVCWAEAVYWAVAVCCPQEHV